MKAEHLSKVIGDWIARKVHEAGAKGVVVGLSGGVDSAVVLALSRRALGENVLGVIMPCESREQDAKDALEMASALWVATVRVDLDRPYHQLLELLPTGVAMAKANLKARLRMTVLYSYANTLDYLVAGTGNKSELTVGYFTKYGDGGADILPIGGLLKRHVRDLAKHLKIPARIIQKPPSAGLWPGQTDEEELGISYEVLDEIIDALDANRRPAAPAEAVRRVKALVEASGHKRALPAICPVGTRSGTPEGTA